MEISEKTSDVINDLIEINNDRVEGFEKASRDLEDDDNAITTVFEKLAEESRQNVVELTNILQNGGYAPVDGTSTSGALHRAWIDIKATFTGHDREAILNECERGEDAIKDAYRKAINPENELSYDLVDILQRQQQGVIEGHNQIKSLRDQAAAEDDADDTDADEIDTDSAYADHTAPGTAYAENAASEPYYNAPVAGQTTDFNDTEQETDYEDETETEETGSGNSRLMEFFVNELKDLLWAERELVETLPDMAEAATSQELKDAFENHLSETEVHVTRLEQIFGILGLEPESRKCEAMAGIIDEGDDIIDATEEGTAQRDVGLIFAGQKAEHYEIASYGGMIALAKTLGHYEIADTLVLTLDEEKTADGLLTEIAENQANHDASTELAED